MDTTTEIQMESTELYKEEVFTDNRVGTLRRMTPVTADGEIDSNRPTLFLGATQILTPGGALPLSFEIEADNLADAIDGFGDAAKQAVDRTMEELKEMQRQAASSIVVPKGDGGFGGPGGNIQMP